MSTPEHGIESCFKCLAVQRKQVKDRLKELLHNNNNNNNNNKKISRKSHWSH